jgi:hypothetical protein
LLAVSAGIADTSSVEAVEAVKEKSSRDVAEKQLIKKKKIPHLYQNLEKVTESHLAIQ